MTRVHFLALTCVIVVIIALLAPRLAIAMISIAAVLQFAQTSETVPCGCRKQRARACAPAARPAAPPAECACDSPHIELHGNERETLRSAPDPESAPDADEANAQQGLARNDPTRVEAGIFNRRTDMDGFLREESEDCDKQFWWGEDEV